jgi:hypothetical protein
MKRCFAESVVARLGLCRKRPRFRMPRNIAIEDVTGLSVLQRKAGFSKTSDLRRQTDQIEPSHPLANDWNGLRRRHLSSLAVIP